MHIQGPAVVMVRSRQYLVSGLHLGSRMLSQYELTGGKGTQLFRNLDDLTSATVEKTINSCS